MKTKKMCRIESNARYAVVGYGSWATALVKILTENGGGVEWHIAKREIAESIRKNRRNPRYLNEIEFDLSRITISEDINRVVERSDVVILAVPSAFLEQTLEGMTVDLSGKFIVSAIKGIVPYKDEYLTVAEYVNKRYGMPFDTIGLITGPCHSEEVAAQRYSYLTMVCKEIENAEVLCERFRNSYIMANPSTDIYGAEYAAVLKNIYAIAAGVAKGLDYGDNMMSVLIANAAVEMYQFIARSYPARRFGTEAPYLGDLLVTCYSEFSRNRRFGKLIGEGETVEQVMQNMSMVSEGYYACKYIAEVNKKHGVDMPIADAMYRILYEGKSAAEQIDRVRMKLL